LLHSEAARDIAREIQLSLTTQQRQRLAAARQVDPKTYEAYLKGIYFSNKRSAPNFKRAIEYFQQAIEKDPNYALAYSGLSDALLGQIFTGTPSQKVRERATRTALKSVELDPSLPEVHNSLAGIREFYDWDWPSAEREYQRAIELNQSFAAAHQDYAIFLALQGPLRSGFFRGSAIAGSRRYDQAIAKCRQALELDPDFLHAHGNLAGIYESMGKYDQAIEEYAKSAAMAGETPARLAELRKAFRQVGIKVYWRKQLELEEEQPGGTSDPYEVASLYCRLGETNQALEWLQKAYQERSPRMEELKEEPAFDNLRSDPRFGDFLRRVGLLQR